MLLRISPIKNKKEKKSEIVLHDEFRHFWDTILGNMFHEKDSCRWSINNQLIIFVLRFIRFCFFIEENKIRRKCFDYLLKTRGLLKEKIKKIILRGADSLNSLLATKQIHLENQIVKLRKLTEF